jgi:hypothetical protein
MKTAFDIDEALLERLREEAELRGTTMSALVEAGILRVLNNPQILAARKKAASKPKKPHPPIPTWKSGGHLVNIDDREDLYRATDLERDMRLYGKQII